MGERVTYLIEIEQSRPGGDFDGNDLPESMKPMTALQLQRAIAYDLVRIRTAELNPFENPIPVVYNPRAADSFKPPVGTTFKETYAGWTPPTHRPEFG